MELGDRGNWYLSALVGVLLAANAVAWVPRASGFFEWTTIIALAVGGLLAMANGVRALRDPGQTEGMEWTASKTRLNAVAAAVLALALAVQAAGYIAG